MPQYVGSVTPADRLTALLRGTLGQHLPPPALMLFVKAFACHPQRDEFLSALSKRSL